MSKRSKDLPLVESIEPQHESKTQLLVKLKIEPLKEEEEAHSASKQTSYPYDEDMIDGHSSTTDGYLLESIDFEEPYHSDERSIQSDCPTAGGRRKTKACRKYTFCSTCGKYIRNIEEHRRMHLNIRLQHCPYCEKSFVHRSNFYTHLNIHTRKRTYKCTLCSSEFNSPHGLKQHQARHSDTKHECLECGKQFVRMSYLRIHHQRVHEPRIRHTCLICDKQFLDLAHVAKHMEVHNNEDLLECGICRRAYKARKNLLRHMRVAHPECVELSDPS
uniref:C2H2-type domain-containing protein n=1 Tax=Anopheles atroparvus TaxID=41427 RepID=A0AAG5DGX3_ANOAO